MKRMDKYFNVHFICDRYNNEWLSNHALMAIHYLWVNLCLTYFFLAKTNHHKPPPTNHKPTVLPPHCSDKRQRYFWANDSARLCTNDFCSPSQMTVWEFGTTSVPYFRTRIFGVSWYHKNSIFLNNYWADKKKIWLMLYRRVSLVWLLVKNRILSFTFNVWRKMSFDSFQVKFQFQIRQKCRSKWNDIGHTLELGKPNVT